MVLFIVLHIFKQTYKPNFFANNNKLLFNYTYGNLSILVYSFIHFMKILMNHKFRDKKYYGKCIYI